MKNKAKLGIGLGIALVVIAAFVLASNKGLFKGSIQPPTYQSPWQHQTASESTNDAEEAEGSDTCGGGSCEARLDTDDTCDRNYSIKKTTCQAVQKSCKDLAVKKRGTQQTKAVGKCNQEKSACDNRARGETACCYDPSSVCCGDPTSKACQEDATGMGI